MGKFKNSSAVPYRLATEAGHPLVKLNGELTVVSIQIEYGERGKHHDEYTARLLLLQVHPQ